MERTMYVIEVTAAASGGAITIAGRPVSDGNSEIFYLPADRCSWQISAATGGGYNIGNVYFYDGNGTGHNIGSVTNATLSHRFGFIGKSGRFVEMAG